MLAPSALTFFLLLASPSHYLISLISRDLSWVCFCSVSPLGEGEDSGIVASSKSGTGGLGLCSTPGLLSHPVLLLPLQ